MEGEDMSRPLTTLTAFIGAVLAVCSGADESLAQTNVLNLVCYHAQQRTVYFSHWIDLDKGTITSTMVQNEKVDFQGVRTVPVEITPEAFTWNTSMGQVTINRFSGLNTWWGPPLQYYNCQKGSLPFPSGIF
jgi:hypothetical protein